MRKRVYELKELMEIIDFNINDQEENYYYFVSVSFNFKNNIMHVYFHDTKYYFVSDFNFDCSEKIDSYFINDCINEQFTKLGYFCEIEIWSFEIDFEENVIEVFLRFKEVSKYD